MIPFNRPHGFKVVSIDAENIKTMVPYKKRNFNHIKGIHACALATLCELTTGLQMLTRLDPKAYRLIMQTMTIDYHYQAKRNAYATFSLTKEWMEEQIFSPLKFQDAVVVQCQVEVHDEVGNHLCTGKVSWQVKSWSKVKTKQ